MRAFAFRGIQTAAVLACAVMIVSCARNHDLEFIEVTPATQTLGVGCSGPLPTDCAPTTTYLAIGHYIHPSDQHDLTSQVQWSTSNPDIITFADPSQPNVLFPTGTACGTGLLVRATLSVTSENLKIGTATVNVNCGSSGGTTGPTTDFTLTANPAQHTVSPGGSASYTINVIAVSGTPSVQLAINNFNLPSGITAGLNPLPPITAPGTTQLTLTASPSQAANPYTVQIIGSDSSGSLAISVILVVS